MSFKATKCDLSAGIAKLDLEILIRQVEIHFYSLMEKMQKQATEVKNNCLSPIDKKDTLLGMVSHGSDSLARLSKQITETSELLHTLYNTDDREIEIVR